MITAYSLPVVLYLWLKSRMMIFWYMTSCSWVLRNMSQRNYLSTSTGLKMNVADSFNIFAPICLITWLLIPENGNINLFLVFKLSPFCSNDKLSSGSHFTTCWRWNRHSVPKRRLLILRRSGNTQKTIYQYKSK